LLYSDLKEKNISASTNQLLGKILLARNIRFNREGIQVIGIIYRHHQTNYIIIAEARDNAGYIKLRNFKFTLSIAFIIACFFIYIAGYIFASKALQPVSALVDRVEEITATNLDLRIKEGNGKDEISELAITFNAMLNRLEKSFDAQKEFVSNISHELRTPLTAMLTELQVAVEKERSTESYKSSINRAIDDARKLVRLFQSLLDLAKANYDHTEISFKELRLDEVILDARNDLLRNHPEFKINIIFEQEIEDDDFISVLGNEYLLKVAFMNLIDNGCKFSEEHEASVAITYLKEKTILRFQDNGIGIIEEELTKIFNPFFRGGDKKFVGGNGIGLSLTQKIIDLHQGSITVNSQIGKGTLFTVELRHV
jgi:signal transduction histidine kinase